MYQIDKWESLARERERKHLTENVSMQLYKIDVGCLFIMENMKEWRSVMQKEWSSELCKVSQH